MPTLLLQEGFKFFFYANEHALMHIHVMRGDAYARIEIGTWTVTRNTLKPRELARALEISRDHQALFEEKWNEWFNRR